MQFESSYQAHLPDSKGYIAYSSAENYTWQVLFERQIKLLPNRACAEFITGLDKLELSASEIPQLPILSARLAKLTNWQLKAVGALISAQEFFELLAQRKFPVATFIRSKQDIDYIKEPDIFHETFGHCPLLTQPVFADFVQQYAQQVLKFPQSDWPLLQRMFWFSVEFGLIQTSLGLRAYGGGILSSATETVYSVESSNALRATFEPVAVFRTPYRIDMLQPIYYVLQSYQDLYQFVNSNINKFLETARKLGEYPPFFEVDHNNPNIHIRAC